MVERFLNGWVRLWVVVSGIWFIGAWGYALISFDYSYYSNKVQGSIGSTLGASFEGQKKYWSFRDKIERHNRKSGMTSSLFDSEISFSQSQFKIIDIELDWLNRVSSLEFEVRLMLVLDDPTAQGRPLLLYPVQPAHLSSVEDTITAISSLASSQGINVTSHLPSLLTQHKALSIEVKEEEKRVKEKFISNWNKVVEQDIKTLGLVVLTSMLPPFLLLIAGWIYLKAFRWILQGFKRQN